MDAEIGRPGSTAAGTEPRAFGRRISTETKAAYRTTEFAVYVVVFVGILLASFLVKTGQDGQRVDYFRADKAWWYHAPDHRLHDRPWAGQVRQPRALRRRPPLGAWAAPANRWGSPTPFRGKA
jgi:hypothetical protein